MHQHEKSRNLKASEAERKLRWDLARRNEELARLIEKSAASSPKPPPKYKRDTIQ